MSDNTGANRLRTGDWDATLAIHLFSCSVCSLSLRFVDWPSCIGGAQAALLRQPWERETNQWWYARRPKHGMFDPADLGSYGLGILA